MIEIELPFPTVSGNHRHGRAKNGRVFLNKKARAYYNDVFWLIKEQKIQAFDGPVEIHMHVFEPTKHKRDIDGVLKTYFDAVEFGRLVNDDSQFRRLVFDFAEERVKGGKVIARLKEWEPKESFWAW